jgi:hypothetical protein
MKTTFDVKSVMLGLLIGAGVLFATGAENAPPEQLIVGRYELQACPGTPNGFAMILDTATGKVWMGNGTVNQLRSDTDFFDPKLK